MASKFPSQVAVRPKVVGGESEEESWCIELRAWAKAWAAVRDPRTVMAACWHSQEGWLLKARSCSSHCG